ncbi:UNVERIFIED_CONTAM: hypothetical protein K2H54_053828 [Gekko kuhli]
MAHSTPLKPHGGQPAAAESSIGSSSSPSHVCTAAPPDRPELAAQRLSRHHVTCSVPPPSCSHSSLGISRNPNYPSSPRSHLERRLSFQTERASTTYSLKKVLSFSKAATEVSMSCGGSQAYVWGLLSRAPGKGSGEDQREPSAPPAAENGDGCSPTEEVTLGLWAHKHIWDHPVFREGREPGAAQTCLSREAGLDSAEESHSPSPQKTLLWATASPSATGWPSLSCLLHRAEVGHHQKLALAFGSGFWA